jgi:hypothetical protein
MIGTEEKLITFEEEHRQDLRNMFDSMLVNPDVGDMSVDHAAVVTIDYVDNVMKIVDHETVHDRDIKTKFFPDMDSPAEIRADLNREVASMRRANTQLKDTALYTVIGCIRTSPGSLLRRTCSKNFMVYSMIKELGFPLPPEFYIKCINENFMT